MPKQDGTPFTHRFLPIKLYFLCCDFKANAIRCLECKLNPMPPIEWNYDNIFMVYTVEENLNKWSAFICFIIRFEPIYNMIWMKPKLPGLSSMYRKWTNSMFVSQNTYPHQILLIIMENSRWSKSNAYASYSCKLKKKMPKYARRPKQYACTCIE